MTVVQTDPAPAPSLADPQHPAGTIGVSAGEFLRYGGFVMSLAGCWKPPGTRVSLSQSISIPENMNQIIREMPADSQWLWIQADDHRWGGQALRQLLDRELDVVVPLILRRGPPFVPLIFKERVGDGLYKPFAYEDLPATGTVEVVCAGSGGMLIRRHVLDAIVEQQGHDRVFEYEAGERLNEDFILCEKIRSTLDANGDPYRIHCDVEVIFGHTGLFTIWPNLTDRGTWQIGFDMGQGKDGRRSTFYFDPHDT